MTQESGSEVRNEGYTESLRQPGDPVPESYTVAGYRVESGSTLDQLMSDAHAILEADKVKHFSLAEAEVSSKLINYNNTGDIVNADSVFLTEDQGLFDTVNRRFPEIWANYKEMKSLDWDEQEFGFEDCEVPFNTVNPAIADRMRLTLGWQWEGDTTAARAMASIASNFIGCSELAAAWIRIADNENVHVSTYSEIVRLALPSKNDPIHEIIRHAETTRRMETLGKVFSACHKRSLMYGLGMVPNDQETYNHAMLFTTCLLLLERIQFMASFAVTFAIGRIPEAQGFQPIVKAVQKICQDELEVHVQLDKLIIANELRTERGRKFLEECWELIDQMINEVVTSEVNWARFLLVEDDRPLAAADGSLRLTFEDLRDWIYLAAHDVCAQFGLPCEYPLPEKVAVTEWIGEFLNISATQSSNQEQQNNAYKTNVIRRDDSGMVFDFSY